MASTSTPTPTTDQGNDVETVTHIQMAGLTVLMIKKKDQVIYKLPDNMSVQSLTQEQRDRLLVEINLLHHQQTTAQAIAATQAQTQQVQMAQAQGSQGVRSIAPVRQGTYQNGSSTPSTPNSAADQKTTRRYNKTGKYSKKKLQQQQQLEQEAKSRSSSNGSSPYPQHTSTTPSTGGLSTAFNQPEQVKLLTEIHQLHQALKLQENKTESLKEQEQILHRTLTLNAPIDTQNAQKQKVRQQIQEAEQTLALVKMQLQKKEALFRQLYPVASQQLLQLQQQQLLQQQQQQQKISAPSSGAVSPAPKAPGSATALGNGSMSGVPMMAGMVRTGPKTVEEQLQQKIAEHHDSVRTSMAEELQKAQRAVRYPDTRTPFRSLEDAIERLIPYHIYQYPDEDLKAHAKEFGTKFETELDQKAKSMHKRKLNLFQKYNDLIKSSAKQPRTTNSSSALDILNLRFSLEDERAEHRKVTEEFRAVKDQADLLKKELESRQNMLLQQRKAEALLIEQQQKLILERQRQEEMTKLEQIQRQQQQEEQQQHRMDEMQEHLQQQQELRLREEQLQRELEKHHEMELERQLGLKQEQQARDKQS